MPHYRDPDTGRFITEAHWLEIQGEDFDPYDFNDWDDFEDFQEFDEEEYGGE